MSHIFSKESLQIYKSICRIIIAFKDQEILNDFFQSDIFYEFVNDYQLFPIPIPNKYDLYYTSYNTTKLAIKSINENRYSLDKFNNNTYTSAINNFANSASLSVELAMEFNTTISNKFAIKAVRLANLTAYLIEDIINLPDETTKINTCKLVLKSARLVFYFTQIAKYGNFDSKYDTFDYEYINHGIINMLIHAYKYFSQT